MKLARPEVPFRAHPLTACPCLTTGVAVDVVALGGRCDPDDFERLAERKLDSGRRLDAELLQMLAIV
jgi:hypothetical protein